MIHFRFKDEDKRYLFLVPDDEKDILGCRMLMKHINLVDPICNLPTYKGPPFTNDYIWEYKQVSGKVIYYAAIGMWQEIYKYFKKYNIPYDGLDPSRFKRDVPHTFEEFCEIVASWNLKYNPRPYQLECAYKILQWNQSVSQLATRAGKTMLAYIVFRYCKEYLGAHNILMIVPSIDLVKQGYSDFKEYGDYFNAECVWGGGKLVESSDMTIGTFQSLIKFIDPASKKYNPVWYNKFDIVFVDEVHRATAKQTKTIISQPFMKTVKIAFGMTGTLPEENTSQRFGLASLLGAKIQEISPKELMDQGYISKLKIYQHRITYKNELKQLDNWIDLAEYVLSDYVTVTNPTNNKKVRLKLDEPHFLKQYQKILPSQIRDARTAIFNQPLKTDNQKKLEYKTLLQKYLSLSTKGNMLMIERMMVHEFEERLDYLVDYVIPTCDKNTLILAHHTSYIDHIVERLKERFPNRTISCVYGAVSAKKREQIRLMMKDHDDVLLVASYACMGTGLTLANLCYGVFLESFKSNVINMQSIGRGLGLSDNKNIYILHDFVDCFSPKCASRKIKEQGDLKLKIYETNHYAYEIVNKALPVYGNEIRVDDKINKKNVMEVDPSYNPRQLSFDIDDLVEYTEEEKPKRSRKKKR